MYIHVYPYVCQKLLCIYLIPQASHVFLQLVASLVHIPSLPRPHGGRTFQVRRNGNSNGFSTTRNFPPPCNRLDGLRLDGLQKKFQSEPGKRKGLGEKLLWLRHGWTFHSSQLNQSLSLDMFGYCCLSFSMSPVPAKFTAA